LCGSPRLVALRCGLDAARAVGCPSREILAFLSLICVLPVCGALRARRWRAPCPARAPPCGGVCSPACVCVVGACCLQFGADMQIFVKVSLLRVLVAWSAAAAGVASRCGLCLVSFRGVCAFLCRPLRARPSRSMWSPATPSRFDCVVLHLWSRVPLSWAQLWQAARRAVVARCTCPRCCWCRRRLAAGCTAAAPPSHHFCICLYCCANAASTCACRRAGCRCAVVHACVMPRAER
jgi:hypothetical protein